jgi:hypothetical protein
MKPKNRMIAVLLAGLAMTLMAGSAEARTHRFDLQEGKTRSATPDYQLTSWRVHVNGDAVEAWYDSANSRFHVRGVRLGKATVTFKGTYRKIILGPPIRDLDVPFTDTIYVTVVPARRR